jgi:hypothetical protein
MSERGFGRGDRGLMAAPSLPLVLVVLSLFVLMVYETGQTIHDRGSLAELRRTQEPMVQAAAKVRSQLEALASETAELARDGDEGAKKVVEQMRRQGVTLAPPKK